jgi:hypothetical protein
MAQVRTILLAFFMAVALYVYYNSSLSSIKNAIKGFFSPRNILIMLLLIAGVIYYFITHQQLLDILITIMITQVQLLQRLF